VHVPDPAAHGEGPHPLLIVHDGEETFVATVGVVTQLVRADVLPPMVVAAIDNTRRARDLTSPWEGYRGPESGGADAFIRFLDEELVPAIAGRVALAPHRTIVGHSLGGVLVNRILTTRPDLFQGYVSISPSAWWHERGLDDALHAAWDAGVRPGRDAALVLSLANEDPDRTTGTRAGFDELEETVAAAPAPFRTAVHHYPDETHITTFVPALQAGLRIVFEGWDLHPLIVADDFDGLRARVDALSRRSGFEVRPTDAWSLAHMGRARTRAGDPERAIEILEWVRGHHPRSIAVLNFLGEAYEAAALYADADAAYRTSLGEATERGSPMVGWIERRLAAVEAARDSVRATSGEK